MNLEQANVCKVLLKVLTKRGWVPVGGTDYLYWKDGCFLVLYQSAPVSIVSEESCGIGGGTVLSTAPQNSWQIEKDGIILSAGRLSSVIGGLKDEEIEGDLRNNDLKRFLERVDKVLEQSDYQKFANAMSEVITHNEKKCNCAKPVDGMVLSSNEARMFTVQQDVLPWFTINNVYLVTACDAQSVTVSKLNKALTSSVGAPIVMEDRARFVQMCKDRTLQLVTIGEGTIDVPTYSYSPSGRNYQDLPREIQSLCLPTVVEKEVGRLFQGNFNYTYLLEADYPLSEVASIAKLCEEVGYRGKLDLTGVNSSNVDSIVGAAHSGYSIAELVKKSASEIEAYVRNQAQYVTEVIDSLQENGVNPSVASAVPYVVDEVDLWSLHDVASPYDLILRQFEGMHTAEYLRMNGVVSGELFKVNFPHGDELVREELLIYFSGSMDFQFANSTWKEVCARCISTATALCYSMQDGFLVQKANQFLGRDENSLVVYDSKLQPVWRGVCLNEEIVSNRISERNVSL